MNAQRVISHQPKSEFQQIYFNNYLTGTLLFPFGKAMVHTFGIFFYFVIVSLVLLAIPLGFLLDWQNLPTRISEQWQQENIGNLLGLGLIALLGLLGLGISLQMLMKTWATFFRIARSRMQFGLGQSLEFVEGPPTFSGGRRSLGRTTGKPPDTLEVCGKKFDLNHCWRVRELLKVASRNFVGTEALPSGIASGFTLQVPLRAWFVPSTGVLARVDLQEPSQTQILNRAATLNKALAEWRRTHGSEMSPKDLAKVQRLSEELNSLQTTLSRNGSGEDRSAAEDQLATLEDWLRALNVEPHRF
jgi:hypothetical protein